MRNDTDPDLDPKRLKARLAAACDDHTKGLMSDAQFVAYVPRTALGLTASWPDADPGRLKARLAAALEDHTNGLMSDAELIAYVRRSALGLTTSAAPSTSCPAI